MHISEELEASVGRLKLIPWPVHLANLCLLLFWGGICKCYMNGACSTVCGWNNGLAVERDPRNFGWTKPIAMMLIGINFFSHRTVPCFIWSFLRIRKEKNTKSRYSRMILSKIVGKGIFIINCSDKPFQPLSYRYLFCTICKLPTYHLRIFLPSR